METKNKRPVIVGVFVFAALIIFVLGVMTLGGQKSIFNKGAAINAVFDEVNGLQVGNNVWYAGVKVGTITEIALNKEGKVAVEMNIEEKSQPLIKKDAKAKVGADGFIGNKIIVLSGGGPGAPMVEDGSTLLVERAIGTDEMMATFQDNNKNLLAITTNFKTISEQIVSGKGNIGKLLNDEQLFTDLQQAVVTIKMAAVNAQRLAADVSAYTAKLTAKGSLANDLVTDTVLFSRLRSTARQVDALSKGAGEVLADLKEASATINQSINDGSTSVGLLLKDKETAADIKATIKNLQAGTQKLDENMEALQSNFLLRGFFKKKNKDKY
ncbi:MAG TPA: MlaD family protein [Flavisolibacter sp.]|jgi:phospholipid/cholesterol/gamma-HCH transport system substrate-binding protein|nr:MlaD family protein [Flavisolibacter sp.]